MADRAPSAPGLSPCAGLSPRPLQLCSSADKVLLLAHGTTDLLALAQRRGATLHKLLQGSHIFEQDLHKPLGRLSQQDWCRLLINCQQQLKSAELPFLLGEAMLHNPYIALCQSFWAARDLRQALQLACYYRHQLCPGLFPLCYRQQDRLVIELRPALAWQRQQPFQVLMVMALLLTLLRQQLGSRLDLTTEVSVQLQQAAGAAPQQLSELLGCALRFEQPVDSISIAATVWQQPFASADQQKFAAARRTCRQLDRTLGKSRGLCEQVFRLQQRALPQLLTLDEVATRLRLSSSALRRQLGAEHSSFARLQDEARQHSARLLLQQQALSNRQLASLLGYSDEHNFRRAFKRWTGLLPSHFRNFLLR